MRVMTNLANCLQGNKHRASGHKHQPVTHFSFFVGPRDTAPPKLLTDSPLPILRYTSRRLRCTQNKEHSGTDVRQCAVRCTRDAKSHISYRGHFLLGRLVLFGGGGFRKYATNASRFPNATLLGPSALSTKWLCPIQLSTGMAAFDSNKYTTYQLKSLAA